MDTMTIERAVDIPASHWLTIEVPPEIPAGRAMLTLTLEPAVAERGEHFPKTAAEALRMAMSRAADPNRKPVSRHFGKHKGIFGGDGVAYQRAMCDEW
jgi:hypothetical protein